MTSQTKVAIVGLSSKVDPNKLNSDPDNLSYPTEASWAAVSHFPALKKLKEYKLAGVLNSSKESGENFINTVDDASIIPFESIEQLADSKDIDVVVVSVKVPHHKETIEPLLATNKVVYSEWPLARNLDEAEYLGSKVSNFSKTLVGLQSRKSPILLKAKELIASGSIGDVLSTNLLSYSGQGRDVFYKGTHPYMLDSSNGTNLLSVVTGHSFDALLYVLGSYPVSLNAKLKNKFKTLDEIAVDGDNKQFKTGKTYSNDTPTHVAINGTLGKDIDFSVDINAGGYSFSATKGLRWEIHGTKGDIIIEGNSGLTELDKLSLKYATIDGYGIQPGVLKSASSQGYNTFSGNVEAVYKAYSEIKNDRQGFSTEGYPTFKDAIILHRLIGVVEKASKSGTLIEIEESELTSF